MVPDLYHVDQGRRAACAEHIAYSTSIGLCQAYSAVTVTALQVTSSLHLSWRFSITDDLHHADMHACRHYQRPPVKGTPASPVGLPSNSSTSTLPAMLLNSSLKFLLPVTPGTVLDI
jgi:hypothetical protein